MNGMQATLAVAVGAFWWRSDRLRLANRRKRKFLEVIDPQPRHDRLRRMRRLRRLFASIGRSPERATTRLTSQKHHATNVMRVHERVRKGRR